MNHLPITSAAPAIPVMDQPVWSEFDLFDLNALSSPPSWISGSEPTNPNIISAFEADHVTATSRDPALSEYNPDPDHQLTHSNLVQHISSHPTHRNHSPIPHQHPHPHPKLAMSSVDTPNQPIPIPEADAIVDSALEFQSPPSPVLSDLPLSSFDRPDNIPPPSVTAVHPSFIPLTLPSHPISMVSGPVTVGIRPPLCDDACSSQESISTRQDQRMLPHSKKKASSVDTRIARTVGGMVQKQTRRYSAPKSSRYCHLCARHQRCVKMVPCGNVELGLCQKSVCKKCIDTYNLEVTESSWACPHCQNKCPERAKCFAYDRQTARRREKTLRAKMNATAAVTTGPLSKK